MPKFKIDFDLSEDELSERSVIKSYPDIPNQEEDLLPYGGLSGLLYLEIDNQPIFTGIPREYEQKYYVVDYLFPTLAQLIDIIPKLKGESEEFEIELYSSGRAFIIKYIKNNENLLINFNNRSRDGLNIVDFPLEIKLFSSTIIEVTDEYIEKLLSINVNLKDNKFIKSLIQIKNIAQNFSNNL